VGDPLVPVGNTARDKRPPLVPVDNTTRDKRVTPFSLGSCYEPRLKGVSTHGISGHVDETPLVPALKLNRD
jgi:hypothetical protein